MEDYAYSFRLLKQPDPTKLETFIVHFGISERKTVNEIAW